MVTKKQIANAIKKLYIAPDVSHPISLADLERLFDTLQVNVPVKELRECWEFLKAREALTYRFRPDYIAQFLSKMNPPSPPRPGLNQTTTVRSSKSPDLDAIPLTQMCNHLTEILDSKSHTDDVIADPQVRALINNCVARMEKRGKDKLHMQNAFHLETKEHIGRHASDGVQGAVDARRRLAQAKRKRQSSYSEEVNHLMANKASSKMGEQIFFTLNWLGDAGKRRFRPKLNPHFNKRATELLEFDVV